MLVDDEPVKEEQAGLDVQWDDEGNSYIRVEEPQMYRIIQLDDFDGHELKLSSNSDQFRVFAYTFVGLRRDPTPSIACTHSSRTERPSARQ